VSRWVKAVNELKPFFWHGLLQYFFFFSVLVTPAGGAFYPFVFMLQGVNSLFSLFVGDLMRFLGVPRDLQKLPYFGF